MRTAWLLCLTLLLAPACARNQENAETPQEAETGRIRDTTLTPGDTLNPRDTLPQIRDSVPDTTTSR